MQHPGNLASVNTAALHWVQAYWSTVCVSWNVAPCTAHQLSTSWSTWLRNMQTHTLSLAPLGRMVVAAVQACRAVPSYECRVSYYY